MLIDERLKCSASESDFAIHPKRRFRTPHFKALRATKMTMSPPIIRIQHDRHGAVVQKFPRPYGRRSDPSQP